MEFTCKGCGKKFSMWPSDIKRYKHGPQFCSKLCKKSKEGVKPATVYLHSLASLRMHLSLERLRREGVSK